MNAEVSIGDIPQDVLDEVGQHLQQFHVTIIVQPKSSDPNIRLIGSGTLVEVNQTHYILTAAHVWHETRNADQIGFAFHSYSSLLFPRDSIFPKILWNQQNPQEGPDLGLLRLPPTIASQIGTYKPFLNLPKQRAVFIGNPTVMPNRLWAVTGIVGEFSDVQANQQTHTITANCQERVFFGGISQRQQEDGYDYFDLRAKLGLCGVPKSFQGLSGGGLWEICLSLNKSKKIIWNESRRFRGVAFWESDISDEHRIIYCHGPQSIFNKAWESWELIG